jgi:hypothetical protein
MLQLEKFGQHDVMQRELCFLELPSVESWPTEIELSSPKFACLIAWDAERSDIPKIQLLAKKILNQGAISVSVWGKNCDLVHDIFDEEIVGAEIDHGILYEVMTTWHAREPLEDAAFYLVFCSITFENQESNCGVNLAVSIGNSNYAKILREYIGSPN